MQRLSLILLLVLLCRTASAQLNLEPGSHQEQERLLLGYGRPHLSMIVYPGGLSGKPPYALVLCKNGSRNILIRNTVEYEYKGAEPDWEALFYEESIPPDTVPRRHRITWVKSCSVTLSGEDAELLSWLFRTAIQSMEVPDFDPAIIGDCLDGSTYYFSYLHFIGHCYCPQPGSNCGRLTRIGSELAQRVLQGEFSLTETLRSEITDLAKVFAKLYEPQKKRYNNDLLNQTR